MKKFIVWLFLFTAVSFVGCVTVPVKQKFPAPPVDDFNVKSLDTLSYGSSMSGLLKNSTMNYDTAKKNTVTLKAWQEWYDKQSKLK